MISCAVKQPSHYSNGVQPFPGAEAYGKFQPMIPVAQGKPFSHSCTGELKITVDHSICANSVHSLDSSFFYASKAGCGARYHGI